VGSGQRGTSCAAPLWAGFCALINQQAAAEGKPPVGFLNPAIYAIGKGSGYAAAFRDVTMGSNTNPNSLNRWFAASGYDLCTGWGTPTGMGTINALVNFAGPVFVAFGASDPGNGTYDLPYNTMSRGTNGVAAGGTIEIKTAGSSSETMTITKAMNIQAIGGPAVIGHNTP
jgi:subtilase family serine protease